MVARRTAPMERSAHADAIYEADLFVIDGRAWMIGGTGKTRAAAIAAHSDPAGEVAQDSVAIIRDGDTLYGRFDPGALPIDAAERERRHKLWKLDAIAYCLSATDTVQSFAERPREITAVDRRILALALSRQIYPARWAPFYFEPGELARLLSRQLRLQRFLELTAGTAGTKFVVLPWMPRVEAKAALYANYSWPDGAEVGCPARLARSRL